jgi:hypothetical protein
MGASAFFPLIRPSDEGEIYLQIRRYRASDSLSSPSFLNFGRMLIRQ